MAKKIDMLGTASILEDIADVMRSFDELSQEELNRMIDVYEKIDNIAANMNAENIEYSQNAIRNLRKELPNDFEYNYDLLLEAHIHLRAADKLIEKFLDF